MEIKNPIYNLILKFCILYIYFFINTKMYLKSDQIMHYSILKCHKYHFFYLV